MPAGGRPLDEAGDAADGVVLVPAVLVGLVVGTAPLADRFCPGGDSLLGACFCLWGGGDRLRSFGGWLAGFLYPG